LQILNFKFPISNFQFQA